MTPYFIDSAGKRIDIVVGGTVALPIDPITQRTKGVNIAVDFVGPVTFKLNKISPAYQYGPVTRTGIAGTPCKMADPDYPFSASQYSLLIAAGGVTNSFGFMVRNASTPVPTPTPTTPPMPVPTPTGKRWRKGICASLSTGSKVLIPACQKLGCNWIRSWITGEDWNADEAMRKLVSISAYNAAGIGLRPVVHESSKANYATYLAFYKKMLPALAGNKTEAVSIGNELHFSNYGSWTEDQAMELQRAAHDARVATGAKIKLVSCSSFSISWMENMLKKGLANLVDEIAIHYYPTDAKGKIAGIKQFVAMIRKYTTKPITEDEHNIHGKDVVSWTQQNAISDAALAVGYLDSVAYFYATPINQPAGAVYLFANNGTPHQPCWDEWKNA